MPSLHNKFLTMDKKEILKKLHKLMTADETLPLRKGATNLVFGEGNPDAEILFIGEGPGYWEDQKGRPFVGNAGSLLNQLLQSVKLARESVFITNVIHYRPPANRDPLPEEIEAFQPYLDKIIEAINPKVIVTLGRFSMGKFLYGVKISSVHGRAHIVNWKDKELAVVPMYHPAAALRSQEIKLQLFEDFRKFMETFRKLKEEKKEKAIKQMKLL